MAPEVTSGTTVAGYRIVSLIGSGAMGSVYLADDTTGGGRVALKVLIPELDRDERFRQRFLRESELVAGLDHPNIVPTLGSGEDDGRLYLAMAYIEGSDLRGLLRSEGRLEPDRALGLLGQVADALDAAHAAGLVHRDVKPGNILVTGDEGSEHAYVCDFGLARHVSSVSSLTGDRAFVGTIDYVPPEQIESGQVDGRADVYSLGCVLYECLAGVRPFDRESELSVVFAHLNEPPPAITEVRPELPEPFDDVFATALAKDPGERYPTCGELIRAARAAEHGKTVGRHTSRGRGLLGAATVIVAAAAATGGILATEGPDASTTGPPAITQTSIAGARLGLTAGAYQKLFGDPGIPLVQPRNEPGKPSNAFPTLTFENKKVWVFFPDPATFGLPDQKHAGIVVTWNKDDKTDRGVGPCSTLSAVEKAYGKELKPDPFSVVPLGTFAYDVGKNLIFSVETPRSQAPSKYVEAVGLFDDSVPGANESQGARPIAGFVIGFQSPRCTG